MTALLALLEHFHPKVKGAVSGAGIGAAIIALLIALGVQLTDTEKAVIDNVCMLLIAYLVPSPSDPPAGALVEGVAQTFTVRSSTADVTTESNGTTS